MAVCYLAKKLIIVKLMENHRGQAIAKFLVLFHKNMNYEK